mgnify:CR=1 FL=1
MTTITIELPDDIAEQARREGLLSARAIRGLLEDTLRLRQHDRDGDIEAIRAALIEGERSGEPRPFDPAAFRQRMRAHG